MDEKGWKWKEGDEGGIKCMKVHENGLEWIKGSKEIPVYACVWKRMKVNKRELKCIKV